MYELLKELNLLAITIKEAKLHLKHFQRENNYREAVKLQHRIPMLKWEFRHKHIAYSLLRGTPLDKIEKPREGNEPDMDAIKAIMEEFAPKEILYVFVRQDLSLAQQAVQAGHAISVASSTPARVGWKPEEGTIVILAVDDEDHLKDVIATFSGIGWHEFREPDMDNELTSVAAFAQKGYFWRFHTAKFKRRCCKFFETITNW